MLRRVAEGNVQPAPQVRSPSASVRVRNNRQRLRLNLPRVQSSFSKGGAFPVLALALLFVIPAANLRLIAAPQLYILTENVLVEAAAGAGLGGIVFDFAFAEAFGVLGGVVVALFLFCGGEAALFAARDAFMGVHTFEKELGGANGGLGSGFGVDFQRA